MKIEIESTSKGSTYEITGTGGHIAQVFANFNTEELAKTFVTCNGEKWHDSETEDTEDIIAKVSTGEYAICNRFKIGDFQQFGTGIMLRVKHPTAEKVRLYLALKQHQSLEIAFFEKYNLEEEMEYGAKGILHAIDVVNISNLYYVSEIAKASTNKIETYKF